MELRVVGYCAEERGRRSEGAVPAVVVDVPICLSVAKNMRHEAFQLPVAI